MPQSLTSLFNGKPNQETRAFVRCTFNADTAANAFGGLPTNMQSQASTFPNWFGSKKRSKNFVNNFGRYSWAIVPGDDFDGIASLRKSGADTQFRPFSPNQRVMSIQQQIQQQMLSNSDHSHWTASNSR